MTKKKKTTWEPSAKDYLTVIVDQNPWMATGHMPEAWAFTKERPLAKFLWKRMQKDKPRRFQLILGPRRVGKTTTMYQTARYLLNDKKVDPSAVTWLRLDHPILMTLDLGGVIRSKISTHKDLAGPLPIYLFLDELTYARDWDLWLKTFYDENWPVQIVGSSSSTAALRDRKIESGVGRWEEQYLPPYLFTEFLDLIGEGREIPVQDTFFKTLETCVKENVRYDDLEAKRRRYLLTGGFPELLLGGTASEITDESALLQSQRILKSDAVQSAIYKDIPQAFGVDNPMMLERLLYTLAGQIGGILSPNTICQSLSGMSQPTFDRYLSFLERSFLVFTLPNYSGSEASIQKRGRKLYFVDTAVRNAALQRGLAPLNDDNEMGFLLENLVAGHIHALSQQTQVRLYHWRDKDLEVDLVYDHPERPLAFEIGAGSHHRQGLYAFSERYERFHGGCFVVTPGSSLVMPQKGTVNEIGSIPLDLFLLAAGAQASKELENNLLSVSRQA